MPPFLMMGVRSLLAGALLFGWARLRDGARPAAAHWPPAAAVGIVLFLGCHGLLAWAEQTVPSGHRGARAGDHPGLDDAARLARRRGAPAVAGRRSASRWASPGSASWSGPARPGALRSRASWRSSSARSPGPPARSFRGGVSRPANLTLASGMQLLCGGAALVAIGLLLGEGARVDAGVLAPRALLSFAYMVGHLVARRLHRVHVAAAGREPDARRHLRVREPGGGARRGLPWSRARRSRRASLGASLVIVSGVALIVTGARGPRKEEDGDRTRVEGEGEGRRRRRRTSRT